MKRQKMRTEQKSNVKNSVGRLVFVGLSLLLQVLWILLLFLRLNAYSTAISLCFSVGAFLVALSIYAKHENAAFKMPWIILILAFPVLGLCIYLVFGHKNVVAKAMRRRFETIEPVLFEQIPQDEAVLGRLEEQDFAGCFICCPGKLHFTGVCFVQNLFHQIGGSSIRTVVFLFYHLIQTEIAVIKM